MIFRIVHAAAVAVLLAGDFTSMPLAAQWLRYPTPGVPRTVDSIGFRDGLWLDMAGSPLSDAAKVRERIRRPAYGHVEIEVTVDDPTNYTKPWTVMLKQAIVVDTELVDEICLENEKSWERMQATPQR
jgi:hypothetical protein